MAAESPRKAVKYNCCIVRPQPYRYSDKSVVESVVDFFSDVVPQAYSSGPKTEEREKVLWVKFEKCDVNDICSNPNLSISDHTGFPILVVLGYSNGVQIWHITYQGEAMEVLSLRQGPICVLKMLPTPAPDVDAFTGKRPLVAVCDSSSAGQPFCCVKFVSLRSGDEVHSVSFKTLQVHSIEANKRYLVMVFQEKLAVFDACRLKQLFQINGCYPCPGINVNPIALGSRWLAYADKRLVPVHQSSGGMSGDGSQSYAATVISAAKGAFKGLTMFGEAMVHSVTGSKPAQSPKKQELAPPDENGYRPGIVSVVDLKTVSTDHFSVSEDPEIEGLIAHFHAHANEPVAAMAFDPSSTLLLTACKLGHNFHVFRLMAHPCSSSLGAVHHLYTLHRGDTTAKVMDVTFTNDSRWVAVSTHRGTTHVFPITPYGGPVTVRTHCQARVVNRASRFHKSAGLDELDQGAAGRQSPVLSSSPGSSGPHDHYPSLIRQNALNNNMGNPRLPPFPHPTTIYPLSQIKQQILIAGLGAGISSAASSRPQSPPHSASAVDNVFSVAACFAAPRLWITSSSLNMDRQGGKKLWSEGLFVVSQNGTVTQYLLEPRPRAGATEKVNEDMALDLGVTGQLQWTLNRPKSSPEVKPPLPLNSPLIQATDAVLTQQLTPLADGAEPAMVTRYDSRDSLSDHSSRDEIDEHWLSQVEIITHAGPHRRLWMGPQFVFKTYQNTQNTTVLSSSSPSLLSQSPETQVSTMDIIADQCDLESLRLHPPRSSPMAMPVARPAYRRSSGSEYTPSPGRSAAAAPLLIEAGSFDQSPNLNDVMCGFAESSLMRHPRSSEEDDDRLRQTLADAMAESPIGEGGPTSTRLEDVFHGSNETLSTSSGSSNSALNQGHRSSDIDIVFPSVTEGSPDLLG
ncbi:breast carcinoma-amplified sequence 3-like isoform X1 [Pomacea canaliculata]|uniref:breast carcinoma-amplified sequence 3-like isoform X1 n=1 Tax=Pomacea canaliculata TaxID=400727 RepID=UPI000D73DE01|nr:breast carcinoma-amplified sequence 3-like isoform X1 [Pomacea canaliculata]